jgi:hypothetical protein
MDAWYAHGLGTSALGEGSQSMATNANTNDPAHWRQCAEEARRVADQLDDPVAKKAMMEIAQSYETLAKLAASKTTSPR